MSLPLCGREIRLPNTAASKLRSGVAEILFGGGGRGLLKGPASLEIRSGNSAGLTRGTLTVDNHTLESFDVFAPGMKYSLKSTELAVDVSAAGVQEVHVFRGRVNAAKSVDVAKQTGTVQAVAERGRGNRGTCDRQLANPDQHHASHRTGGQRGSCRIGVENKPVERFEADPTRFVRPAEFAEIVPHFVRWKDASRQTCQRSRSYRLLRFPMRYRVARTVLRNGAASGERLDGRIEGPKWLQGRWPTKGALQFYRPEHCVRVNIPGRFAVATAAAGRSACTICSALIPACSIRIVGM